MMEHDGQKYRLPPDWQPTYKQPYESEDKRFEIWLSYEGIQSLGSPMHLWITALVVRGIILDAGPFYWDPSDRELTNENVANHMITWWKDADFGAMLEAAAEEYKKWGFDPKIRAVALVDMMYYPAVDVDFEIVWFTKIGDSWKILICNSVDDRYHEVIHDATKQTTQVVAYSMVDQLEVDNEALDNIN